MKNVRDIELFSQNRSFDKKLRTYRSMLKLKLTLPQRVRDSVMFMYVKNRTLYFVLDHPAYVMEFNNYSLGVIKGLLKSVPLEGLEEIKDVKCFVSNKIKKEESVDEDNSYKEHSRGEFENHLKDEKLREKVEEIREVICSLRR